MDIMIFEMSGCIGVFHASYDTKAGKVLKLVHALKEQHNTAGL